MASGNLLMKMIEYSKIINKRRGEGHLKNDSQFSKLIYEYFLIRFRFNYYKYGDILPTIDKLCQEFGVGAQTVKAALRRLRDEGYISMQSGQFTKVLFRQTKEELAAFIRLYYSGRRAAFSDLYKSSELVFVPMLTEGLRRMDENDLAYLEQLSICADMDDLFHFYSYTLQKVENPLTINLFLEVSLFLGFPFGKMETDLLFYDNTIVSQRLQTLLAQVRAQDWDSVHQSLLSYQRSDVSLASTYLNQLARRFPTPEQTPFVWRVYRDRPQLCYSLAVRIMHEIYMGEYRETEFLPSYEKMAEKYDVSVSTMRRTVRVLNQAGVAESVNGIGTRIFTVGKRCNEPDFDCPAVRRNLALFAQSFEMIIYSCREASYSMFSSLSKEVLSDLIRQLEEYKNTGKYELSTWQVLICIAKYSPFKGVREIYSKVYGLFLWGYPLKGSFKETSRLDRISEQFNENLTDGLKRKDYCRCSAIVEDLFKKQFPVSEDYLQKCGLRPEELWLSHPICLF